MFRTWGGTSRNGCSKTAPYKLISRYQTMMSVTVLVHNLHIVTVIDTEKLCNPQGREPDAHGGTIRTRHPW
jgi:hypothetical protein